MINQSFEGVSFYHVDDAEVEAEMAALLGSDYRRR
jgi:hypothetical protein